MDAHLAPAWRSQVDDDSTSAQYGDVSSTYSAKEEDRENDETDTLDDIISQNISTEKPRKVRKPHERSRKNSSSQRSQSEDRLGSQGSAVEIVDLEDGGYDGDAEVQHPDGVEEADSGAEESEVSHLTLEESNDDDDALADELQKLRVKARRKHNMQARQPVERRHHQTARPPHKRTHSESFDDLTEENDANDYDEASSPPAYKRSRQHSMPTTVHDGAVGQANVMDMS